MQFMQFGCPWSLSYMYSTHTANTVDRNHSYESSADVLLWRNMFAQNWDQQDHVKNCVRMICGEEETTQWELDYKCYICRAVDVKIWDTQRTYEDMLITDSTFHCFFTWRQPIHVDYRILCVCCRTGNELDTDSFEFCHKTATYNIGNIHNMIICTYIIYAFRLQ